MSNEVTVLLRSIFDEVCVGVPVHETGKKAFVASKLLECASAGERNVDALRLVGRRALQPTDPVWS